jgi:proteasome lid subunit RPN8/RPN11
VTNERPPIAIPARILNELRAHALESDPEECCGLLLSQGGHRYGKVKRCHNEMTLRHEEDPEAFPPADNRAGYSMSPADVLEAMRESDETGAAVTAVYHSHVGAPAYLSAFDRHYLDHALFPFPHADQIVLSVFEHRVLDVKLFRRRGTEWDEHLVREDES